MHFVHSCIREGGKTYTNVYSVRRGDKFILTSERSERLPERMKRASPRTNEVSDLTYNRKTYSPQL